MEVLNKAFACLPRGAQFGSIANTGFKYVKDFPDFFKTHFYLMGSRVPSTLRERVYLILTSRWTYALIIGACVLKIFLLKAKLKQTEEELTKKKSLEFKLKMINLCLLVAVRDVGSGMANVLEKKHREITPNSTDFIAIIQGALDRSPQDPDTIYRICDFLRCYFGAIKDLFPLN